MASRPVFVPWCKKNHLVNELIFDFSWSPGFSPSQKKKNINALHDAAKNEGLFPLLEVSSKSIEIIGKSLSAFNLMIETEIGFISVESAFQGSKVFEHGGPYTDIYRKSSHEAKKDDRIKNSGKLISFNYFGDKWPNFPKTAFYDWLYIKALYPHKEYLSEIIKFNGFTDIEFNQKKSINCQARTCAMVVSLIKLDYIDIASKSQEQFNKLVSDNYLKQNHSNQSKQLNLWKT